jgi:hypothetical protein
VISKADRVIDPGSDIDVEGIPIIDAEFYNRVQGASPGKYVQRAKSLCDSIGEGRE